MNYKLSFLDTNNLISFYQLFSVSVPDGIQEIVGDVSSFNYYLNFLNVNSKVSFILSVDNECTGLFLAAVRGEQAYIPAIVVHKKLRGQGYGRLLLEKGLQLLEKNLCRSVTLDVDPANYSAVRLYETLDFKPVNTLTNYRNEKNSFYYKNVSPVYRVELDPGFTFNFLYAMFHEGEQPWQKSLPSLLNKLLTGHFELYLLYHNSLICGYMIVHRKNGCLNIHSISLKASDFEAFGYFITSAIHDEKVVQANGFYEYDPLCCLFGRHGFYIDSKQYEMKRDL